MALAQSLLLWPEKIVFGGAVYDKQTTHLNRGGEYLYSLIYVIGWQVNHSCLCQCFSDFFFVDHLH